MDFKREVFSSTADLASVVTIPCRHGIRLFGGPPWLRVQGLCARALAVIPEKQNSFRGLLGAQHMYARFGCRQPRGRVLGVCWHCQNGFMFSVGMSRAHFFEGLARPLTLTGVEVGPGPVTPWSLWSVVTFACWIFQRLKNVDNHWNRNAWGREPRNFRHVWMRDVSEMPTVTRSRTSGSRSSQLLSLLDAARPKSASSCRQCALQFSSVSSVVDFETCGFWVCQKLLTVIWVGQDMAVILLTVVVSGVWRSKHAHSRKDLAGQNRNPRNCCRGPAKCPESWASSWTGPRSLWLSLSFGFLTTKAL